MSEILIVSPKGSNVHYTSQQEITEQKEKSSQALLVDQQILNISLVSITVLLFHYSPQMNQIYSSHD